MKHYQLWALMATLGLTVTGCIDDNYDLSDIDSTVRVTVNDLVVPINIDEITLSSVLNLDEDSKIKNIDGSYAFVEDGTFDSKQINVPGVHVTAPVITPTVTNISIPAGLSATVPANQEITFDISGESTEFSVSTTEVSSYIVKIDDAGSEFELDINITMKGLEGKVNNLRLRGLEMSLPTGLEIEGAGNKYNPATGIYKVGDVTSTGNKVTLHYKVVHMDFNKAGVTYDYDNHTLKFKDDLSLSKATLVIKGSDLLVPANTLPRSFQLVTSFDFTDIDITSFSGTIKYTLDGFNISDVALDDIPEILDQPGTNLRIANPQIYLSLANPVNIYSLTARTGLTITSYRDNNRVGDYSLDAPGYFEVVGTPSVKTYNYYLSPSEVSKLYSGYEGAKHVGYAALSDVLSGDGIPTRLSIDFDNPCLPEQPVKNLPLGVNLGTVKGNYTFFAPLELEPGSTVVYTKRDDGWSTEDLEAVTIQYLEVSMKLSTNVPINLDFTGYPIDKNGHQINNVTIEGAVIKANTDNQDVVLRITGEIRNLDGMEFTARAVAGADASVLSPDMYVKLSNVRPRVSGYYEKEL